jgi:hypothetical protein
MRGGGEHGVDGVAACVGEVRITAYAILKKAAAIANHAGAARRSALQADRGDLRLARTQNCVVDKVVSNPQLSAALPRTAGDHQKWCAHFCAKMGRTSDGAKICDRDIDHDISSERRVSATEIEARVGQVRNAEEGFRPAAFEKGPLGAVPACSNAVARKR